LKSKTHEIIDHIEVEFKTSEVNWEIVNSWEKFEVYVLKIVEQALKKMYRINDYEIYYTSGSNKFPDIVISIHGEVKIGIEVKYKNSNRDWKTLGGSIYESSNINDLDDVLIIVGHRQLREVRVKEYKKCLSDIKITHSPRFFIDVDDNVESVFERLDVDNFDVERLLKEYKKAKLATLQEGESLWWLDNNNNSDNNYFDISLKHYNSLDKNIKKQILTEMFIFFPSILQNDNKKYYLVATFLIQQHNVYHHAIRDFFSAGGKKTSSFGLEKVDAVTNRLIKHLKSIKMYFKSENLDDLKINMIIEMWDKQKLVSVPPNSSNIESVWLETICSLLGKYSDQIKEEYNNISITD